MKKIEFVNNTGTAPDPISKSREVGFRDILFKEEYRERAIRFSQGLTWLRFLPAIRGSIYDWMMPIEIHENINGVNFVSPRTFDSNANGPFDIARMWLQKNRRDVLSSRETNPNGFKLWQKRWGVSWVINESEAEGQRLRLFAKSLYDGSRGGTTGLAYNIRHAADEQDNEPGSATAGQLIHGDITAPEGGRLVKVERVLGEKSEYPSYNVGIGKNQAKIDHFMAMLTEEENDLIVPLENVIHVPTEDEQHEYLRRYIGDELYGLVFSNRPAGQGWEPAKKAETPAPAKVEAKPAPAPVAKPAVEPEPEPTPEPKAAPAAEAPQEEKAASKYTIKEVTALLAKEKPGIEELLANRNRLSPPHLEIVLDSAKEYGIEG